MNNLFKVLLQTTQKTAILQLNESANNILFADRNNENNNALKGRLQKLMSAVFIIFLFFSFSFISCANEPSPAEPKLPWSVFPLDSVKWIEIHEYIDFPIQNNNKWHLDTIIYSIYSIGENKAKVYKLEKKSIGNYKIIDGEKIFVSDSSWIMDSKLFIQILLENNKVYKILGDGEQEIFLMYDFSLKVGDKFISSWWNRSITSIDSVLVGNEYRKKYNFFETDNSHFHFSVIDGIGCDKFFSYILINPYGHFDPIIDITYKVYYKDKLIWERKDPYIFGGM